jgi:hypothetical protein
MTYPTTNPNIAPARSGYLSVGCLDFTAGGVPANDGWNGSENAQRPDCQKTKYQGRDGQF